MNKINRKTVRGTLVLIAAMMLSASGIKAAAAENHTVDGPHSSAQFSIRNFGLMTVRGSFSDISGNISVDRADPASSSVEIVIGTASIRTGIDKRDNHLRSADFFDVQKYPAMRFKSTGVKKTGNNRYALTGDFTLHGVTKTITATVEQTKEEDTPSNGHRIAFKTIFSINRSDFNITTDSPVIANTVKIELVIEATRN